MPTEEAVYAALKDVVDPELGVDVVDLGLVYRVEIGERGRVGVAFTLTYPGCPAAEDIAVDIVGRVSRVPGVSVVIPAIVWDPPWDPSRMSEEARLELGYPI
jgi:metal-sulfur cluster biosynthetic enzyme